jgi:signal peptidase I
MRGFLRFMLWALGILAVIGLVLYLAVFDVWTVPGDDPVASVAIEPTLHSGDHILLTRGSDLKPGLLARCMDPDAPGRYVIGRIVAKGGDTVAVDEIVVVNGKRNPSPHACTELKFNLRNPTTGEDVVLECGVEDTDGNEHEVLRDMAHPQATLKTKVESDKVFLVSDNRHLHLDSRDYGQVTPSSCQHVVYRLWGETYFDAKRRFTFLW